MSFLTRFCVILLLITILPSCRKGFQSTNNTPEEIGRYIAARVPAVIEVSEPVRIRFSVPVDTSQTTSVLAFNPTTEGSFNWEDAATLAFIPNNGWKPGASYQLQVNLDKVIKDVDPNMKKVVFDFMIKPVRMTVSFEPLVPEFDGDQPRYMLRGRVLTSIPVDSAQLEKIFVMKSSGKMSAIDWNHSADHRTHEVVIGEIAPDSKIDFRWDGKAIGAEANGSRSITIPKGNELTMLSFEPGGEGEKKVSIYFSQKLNPSQDINGLVTINGSSDGFTMKKQDHVLSIYPGEE